MIMRVGPSRSASTPLAVAGDCADAEGEQHSGQHRDRQSRRQSERRHISDDDEAAGEIEQRHGRSEGNMPGRPIAAILSDSESFRPSKPARQLRPQDDEADQRETGDDQKGRAPAGEVADQRGKRRAERHRESGAAEDGDRPGAVLEASKHHRRRLRGGSEEARRHAHHHLRGKQGGKRIAGGSEAVAGHERQQRQCDDTPPVGGAGDRRKDRRADRTGERVDGDQMSGLRHRNVRAILEISGSRPAKTKATVLVANAPTASHMRRLSMTNP